MGRDERSPAIETALTRYEGRVAITALHGLRGVGKTTLGRGLCGTAIAATTARPGGSGRRREATMRADLVALGVRLGWVAADEKEEPALAAVMERLRHEGEGILLIYDNAIDAEALKPYLPRGGARAACWSPRTRMLGAASRSRSRSGCGRRRSAPITSSPAPAATAERAAAEALSEALGGLPLAHEQAAAYCERLDISLAEYRKRFEAAPARLLDDERHAPAEYHDGLHRGEDLCARHRRGGEAPSRLPSR